MARKQMHAGKLETLGLVYTEGQWSASRHVPRLSGAELRRCFGTTLVRRLRVGPSCPASLLSAGSPVFPAVVLAPICLRKGCMSHIRKTETGKWAPREYGPINIIRTHALPVWPVQAEASMGIGSPCARGIWPFNDPIAYPAQRRWLLPSTASMLIRQRADDQSLTGSEGRAVCLLHQQAAVLIQRPCQFQQLQELEAPACQGAIRCSPHLRCSPPKFKVLPRASSRALLVLHGADARPDRQSP